jgi:hypothetical protein
MGLDVLRENSYTSRTFHETMYLPPYLSATWVAMVISVGLTPRLMDLA